MEMIELIILGIISIIGISMLIIFLIRYKDPGYDYDKIIKNLNDDMKYNLDIIDKNNKKIDDIEMQILDCKKKLGFKLFKK